MRRILSATTAAAVVIANLLTWSTPAAAHEQRVVGKYTLEAGWHEEPAVVDRPNAVFFEVKETSTGRAIRGLKDTVTVVVTFGGLRTTFTHELEEIFDEPGAYSADIIPTAVGDYSFHFTGKIEDQAIDEKFDSGPGRFDSIGPATDLQYPFQAATVAQLTLQVADLKGTIDQARLIGIAGVVLGLVGLGAAVRLRRRA